MKSCECGITSGGRCPVCMTFPASKKKRALAIITLLANTPPSQWLPAERLHESLKRFREKDS